jgi:hypothetical protein
LYDCLVDTTEVWAVRPLSFVNRTLLIYGLVASGAAKRWSSCWPALLWLGGSVDMNGTVRRPSEHPGAKVVVFNVDKHVSSARGGNGAVDD